ncbi:MAG: biopolymer transporter ExbD, partial [Calditrichaeota bacterium]|nr:biopolymer transporter ExbD [Calditrichota bacterium]
DMMTIILLFLIKSMSTSGAMVRPSQYLELPVGVREVEPEKALSLLISSDGVLEDMEANPNILSSIAELDNDAEMVLPGLEAFLLNQKDFEEKAGIPFKGTVTIQCDKSIPYDWLLKVINTCGQSEYDVMDFIILKKTNS